VDRVTATPSHVGDLRALNEAREQFLVLIGSIRPELHRYCARLTGSVFEGEDVVQETLAKALYALSLAPEVPPLRPWLFRIAHNTALDWLKSHGRRRVDLEAELDDLAGYEDRPDPAAVRAALAHFLDLPPAQRSAVILKDVLDFSLEETAETMDISVAAVKALLVRGRTNLRARGGEPSDPEREPAPDPRQRAELERYAHLFNARDWEGLRALVHDECRLDLVSKSQRRGKQVRIYFGNYEKENVELRVVEVGGRLALAVHSHSHSHDGERPRYFILLEHEDGRVRSIRDFRYVTYIAEEAPVRKETR
jgi:RNA polymerase sigma-70 factor (ECF subfamily)